MHIETEDVSGRLLTLVEVETAERTIKDALTKGALLLPPELVVQLPNVLRCLQVAHFMIEQYEKRETP